MQPLTNEELLKLSDPSISEEVRNYLALQKMTEEEKKICRMTGCKPFEFAVTSQVPR